MVVFQILAQVQPGLLLVKEGIRWLLSPLHRRRQDYEQERSNNGKNQEVLGGMVFSQILAQGDEDK